MKKTILSISVLALAALAAGHAQAQQAGSLSWRVGATQISPSVSSGNLTQAPLGTEANVGSASGLSGGLTYMFSDNIAVDVPLGLPFKHEVTGAGSFLNGVGKLADTKALPITATVQYRFGAANAQFRPYVGAGLTYAMFFDEVSTLALTAATGGTKANPTTVTFKDKLVPALQAGLSFAVNNTWNVDINATYTPLKTRGTLSTGQTLDMDVNPSAISFGIGRRF
jgi:outer membrane protein